MLRISTTYEKCVKHNIAKTSKKPQMLISQDFSLKVHCTQCNCQYDSIQFSFLCIALLTMDNTVLDILKR